MADPKNTSAAGPEHRFRPVGRTRRVYEQVADQLRELIVAGDLAVGDRLPNEVELGERLGVSRATVRESLRVLSAEGLVETRKGARGGSFVTRADMATLAQRLGRSLVLLRATDDVTADEVDEARVLLQVAAARGAAARASDADVERLGALVPTEAHVAETEPGEFPGERFHFALTEIGGNRLLGLALACVSAAVKGHVVEDPRDPEQVRLHTAAIHAAVARRDPDGAERAMREYIAMSARRYGATWQPQAGAPA